MAGTFEDFLKEVRDNDARPEEVLTDLHDLIDKEKQEKRAVHSLSDRVHILHNASNHLFMAEGIFEAEELVDWTIEILDVLDEEEDKALHFVLVLEATEKEGAKWVAKHHDKLVSEVKISELEEEHFLKKIKAKLKELMQIFESIKDDLEDSDEIRIKKLIQSLLHGMEQLEA